MLDPNQVLLSFGSRADLESQTISICRLTIHTDDIPMYIFCAALTLLKQLLYLIKGRWTHSFRTTYKFIRRAKQRGRLNAYLHLLSLYIHLYVYI